MKKLFFLVLSLAFTYAASAQSVRFAPEMGLNFTNMVYRGETVFGRDYDGSFDTKVGVKIGGIVDARITRHFYIQPGLFYSQKGFRAEDNLGAYAARLNYIEMPVNFLYKVGRPRAGKFFIGGGPYIAGAVGGEFDDRGRGPDYDINFGDNADDDFRGFDAGLNFTLGYELPFGLFFRGNAGLGLANLNPENGDNIYNRSFGLSVGYLIGR